MKTGAAMCYTLREQSNKHVFYNHDIIVEKEHKRGKMNLKLHGSFIAVLCYVVTVLLLYLIGDVFNIPWLQFAKGTHTETSLHSLLPLAFAIPVYIIVRFKTRNA